MRAKAALLHDGVEPVARNSSIEEGLDYLVWQPGGEWRDPMAMSAPLAYGLFEPCEFLNRSGTVRIGK